MTTSPEPLTTEEMQSVLVAGNFATIHDLAASAGLATLRAEAAEAKKAAAPAANAPTSLPRR